MPRQKFKYQASAGSPLPQGVHLLKTGVNFSLFSRHADSVSLVVFDDAASSRPSQVFELDRQINKTGDIWHVCLEGAGPGLIYGYKVDGPHQPDRGHRFNGQKILIDPYATALVGPSQLDFASFAVKNELELEPDTAILKCLVTDQAFDWEGDRSPEIPWSDLVIYEAHVKGLTVHSSSASRNPGTFLGVIDMIPYFKELGINAIELMPLQEFNPFEVTARNPETGQRLVNFWGYNTIAFFAPYAGYGTRAHSGCEVNEFKTMVKALHQAGIEVLLDVVFNHTAEGDETGPTLNFRGLDNSIYYMLEEDRRFYKNYSGCGNTMNCNHPVVRNYILDCLRYWVVDMHVDGFRFDLASILGRSPDGSLVPNPPLLEQIAEDPILRGVKLIAEAWDAGGAYLVGRFSSNRWSEWNGMYRDDIRRYWRGDKGLAGAFASRLCGSADIYEHSGKAPVHSINFITCHDGFTLNDLVSYGCKHNLANGESNRDGCGESYSANYGVEGKADAPELIALRKRQMKNFLATLFLSRGVPMLLAGDEFCRTQGGNNNAYCQDNEISWVDWSLLKENRDFFLFVSELIRLRRRYPVLSADQFYRSEEISWMGLDGAEPNWHEDSVLGCHIHPSDQLDELCLLTNPDVNTVEFKIPLPKSPRHKAWVKVLDTSIEKTLKPGSRQIRVAPDSRAKLTSRSLILLAAVTLKGA
jgi:glycogen operon protein